MLISGVKVTLIICLTILVSAVLFISYNEYINRYSIIATQDNNIYIFDKKSTVLNKCSEKGCEVIETKLPSSVSFGITDRSLPSKMFEKNMVEAVKMGGKEGKKDSEEKKDLEPQAEESKKEESNKNEPAKEKKESEKEQDTEFVE